MKAVSSFICASRPHQLLARAEPARDVAARRAGIVADQGFGGLARRFDERAVLVRVGEAQQRHAALAFAQVLARPAQLEVELGDAKAVAVLVDDPQALARRLRELVAEQENAIARARAAA